MMVNEFAVVIGGIFAILIIAVSGIMTFIHERNKVVGNIVIIEDTDSEDYIFLEANLDMAELKKKQTVMLNVILRKAPR